MKINYFAQDFSSSWGSDLKDGAHELDVTWQDIIHAAITVGRENWGSVMGNGIFSIYEIFSKVFHLFAYLKLQGNCLVKSEIYNDLDPSEKSCVSYFLGMTITKLAAHKLFNLPWLVHVDKISKLYNISTHDSTRPDLVGFEDGANKQNWFIFEAKGRTGKFDRGALEQAKDQAQTVKSISGNSPRISIAVESYFDNCLKFHIADPDEPSQKAIELRITPAQLLKSYYYFFKGITANEYDEKEINGRVFLLWNHYTLGVKVGIVKEAVSFLEQEGYSVQEFYKDLRSLTLGDIQFDDYSKARIYNDGLLVVLDNTWNDELMSMAPKRRQP